MSNIFKKHFEHFANKAFPAQSKSEDLYSRLQYFIKTKDFNDGKFLFRFPRKELRYFLRIECPTERHEETRGPKSHDIIKAAKRLRYFSNIPESFACHKCSKRESCKFRDQIPPKPKTSVSDLLIFMNGLNDYNNLIRMSNQATAEPEAQATQNELEEQIKGEQLNNEEKELDDEDEFDADEELERNEHENQTENPNDDQKNNRYSFKTYISAVNVIDALIPVIEDIKVRKGNGIREFISAYNSEKKKSFETYKQNNPERFQDEDSESEEFRKPTKKMNRGQNLENKKKENINQRPRKEEDDEDDDLDAHYEDELLNRPKSNQKSPQKSKTKPDFKRQNSRDSFEDQGSKRQNFREFEPQNFKKNTRPNNRNTQNKEVKRDSKSMPPKGRGNGPNKGQNKFEKNVEQPKKERRPRINFSENSEVVERKPKVEYKKYSKGRSNSEIRKSKDLSKFLTDVNKEQTQVC